MNVSHKAGIATDKALDNSTQLSAQETKMLQGLSGADRERMEAQLMLQKQQETTSFISKILKNNTTMDVINALK